MSMDSLKDILSVDGDYEEGSGTYVHDYHGSLTCGATVMDLNKLAGWYYLSNTCSAEKLEVKL